MTFDLKITFTGVCGFIENSNAESPSRLCVVMPTGESRMALDDELLCPHYCYLEQGSGFNVAAVPLSGNRLSFEYGPINEIPLLVTSPSDLGMPDLATLLEPGMNSTDPDVVKFPPPRHIQTQVILGHGTWTSIKGAAWNINAIGGTPVENKELAYEVTLCLEGLESAAAVLQPFDQSPAKTVLLSPPSDIRSVDLRIINACKNYPATYPKGRALRDRDFKWYYELLDSGSRDAVKESIGRRDLPIPALGINFISGNNCVPGHLSSVAF